MKRVSICLSAIVLFLGQSLVQAQVSLRPKFGAAADYKLQTEAKINQKMTIAGQTQNIVATQTSTVRIKSSKLDGEGKVSVERTNEALGIDMDLGIAKLKFDSAKPDEKAPIPQLEPVLAGLRKQLAMKLTYSVDQEGKVSDVGGVDEGALVNPEDLKLDYQQELDQLPTDPVTKGEQWTRTIESNLGQGQTLTLERTYTYVGSVPKVATVPNGKSLDRVEFTDTSAKFWVKPNRGFPADVKDSTLKIVSSKGEILFDRELGRVVSTNQKTEVSGDFVLSANGMQIAAKIDSLALETETKEVP